jgi:hypothetical protein
MSLPTYAPVPVNDGKQQHVELSQYGGSNTYAGSNPYAASTPVGTPIGAGGPSNGLSGGSMQSGGMQSLGMQSGGIYARGGAYDGADTIGHCSTSNFPGSSSRVERKIYNLLCEAACGVML